jgi:ribonuclease-3
LLFIILTLWKKMERLEKKIGYCFKDKGLLKQALTHRSYAHECKVMSNERLEFLGDAVLELVIRDWFFTHYPKMREGDLTRLKANLVGEVTLANVARSISLNEVLLLGKSERQGGGANKDSILADALEALIGAVYLDSDFAKTKEVVLRIFSPFLHHINLHQIYDYKSTLQNRLQAKLQVLPKYRILKTIGPDHDKEFIVGVYIQGKLWGKGRGKSRKMAEQMAAKEALGRWKDE